MDLDALIDALPDATKKKQGFGNTPIKPTQWNLGENRTPLEILMEERATQEANGSVDPRLDKQIVAYGGTVPKSKPNNIDALISALPDAAQPSAQESPGYLSSMATALGYGVDKAAAGLRQATPAPIRNAIDAANNALGFGAPPAIDEASRNYAKQAMAPIEKQYPFSSAIAENPLQLAAKTPLGMAAMGALDYGTLGERGLNAGLSYAGGKVGEGLARMWGPKSMAGVKDTASDFIETGGNKWGIPTTVGQDKGGIPAIVESVAQYLPFGGAVRDARNASYAAWNEALNKTAGITSDTIDKKALGTALDASGKQIGDIMGRAQAQLSPAQAQRVAELSSVVADLADHNLNAKVGKMIEGMTNGYALSGKTLRMLDSSLGRVIGQGGDAGYAAFELQSILRDAASVSLSDADNAALKLARSQNFNVRQIADANKNGVLTPSTLQTQVNNYQRKARYGGGNELSDLADFGISKLKDNVPNSGTAQRAWYQKLMTSPYAAATGFAGADYLGDKAGIPLPMEGLLAAPIVWGSSRYLAGKPMSDPFRRLLMSGGGLSGGLLGQSYGQ